MLKQNIHKHTSSNKEYQTVSPTKCLNPITNSNKKNNSTKSVSYGELQIVMESLQKVKNKASK